MRPIKRSSLLGPWGVGAMVPFPNNESLMIAGLDVWDYKGFESQFVVEEKRLCSRLGVSELRLPPDFRDSRTDPAGFMKIPAVRFPRWHYCPVCGLMEKVSFYSELPRCRGAHSGKRSPVLLPETVVVACGHGHIDDFPVERWLHEESGREYDPTKCLITRRAQGNTASTSDVYYECSCGAKAYLNGSVFNSDKGLHFACSGAMPWLGVESTACSERAYPCGRGASNLWQGEVESSLYVPVEDQLTDRHVLDVLGSVYDTLSEMKRAGKDVDPLLQFTAVNCHVDELLLSDAFNRQFRSDETLGVGRNKQETEDSYRLAEYRVLIKSSGSDVDRFHSIACDISTYSGACMGAFSEISLVPKLQETRALTGFRRSVCKGGVALAPIRGDRDGKDWIPAIAVYGEGIFLSFNRDRLAAWSARPAVRQRIQRLQGAYADSRHSRKWSGSDLRAEFVMIHTFAHLLINQLTFSCGYGAASLRERVYCGLASDASGMAGVLVYTASGDADGSLGGLVRQGRPGCLERLVADAIEKARWCSRDPVCIQSKGQGPGSCNLAACHSCALLPETSCELGNALLDRALLIGTLEDSSVGFFNAFI